MHVESQTEMRPGHGVGIEDVGENGVGGLVLPDARVLAKAQKVQPRGEFELVAREAAIDAQAPCRMDIAVMRTI